MYIHLTDQRDAMQCAKSNELPKRTNNSKLIWMHEKNDIT